MRVVTPARAGYKLYSTRSPTTVICPVARKCKIRSATWWSESLRLVRFFRLAVSVETRRGRAFPRALRLSTTASNVACETPCGCLAGGDGLAETTFRPAPFGHWKSPRWFKTTWIFSLRDMLPNSPLTALQQATQLSSLLLPARALATRCSTLASSFARGALQKKQRPPCANINRSSGFVGMVTPQPKDSARPHGFRIVAGQEKFLDAMQ